MKHRMISLMLILFLLSTAGTSLAEPPVQTEGITIPVIEEMKRFELPDNEAMALLKDMKCGWNLGNTFDAFNGFTLAMPDNGEWDIANEDPSTIVIYHKAARDEGLGGTLVTLTALDSGDTSYEDSPMPVAIAGENESLGKTFVAIFPSDVQWNPEDAAQGDSYQALSEHVNKLGTEASPFTIVED